VDPNQELNWTKLLEYNLYYVPNA